MAFTESIKLKTAGPELLVVEKFLQGKGSCDARRHGRLMHRRLIEAMESARYEDLVAAVLPWEMSAVQLKRLAATTSRARRVGEPPPEIIALFNAVESGLIGSYKAARMRTPDMDEALMTCLRVHIKADHWFAVHQFLRSDDGEDVYLHLRAALESGEPAHLRALFAPWWLSPQAPPTAEDAGPDSSGRPPPCRRPIRPQLDHYAVLGVGRDATEEAIGTAYRTLCQIYHPDRYQNASTAVVEEAAARMLALNEAYQCLSNAVRRAQYDSSVRQP
jgi:DnaJ-domain-containing protein 1